MQRLFLAFAILLASSHAQNPVEISAAKYGVVPNTGKDSTQPLQAALAALRPHSVLTFTKGRYDFYPEAAPSRHYVITNHDQNGPEDRRPIVFPLESAFDLIIDGGGAEFVFHGAAMPFAIVQGRQIGLKNLSIDYANQHLIQTTVLRAADGTVDVQAPPSAPGETTYSVVDHHIRILAERWDKLATASLEFDSKAGGLARAARDNYKFDRTTAEELSPGILRLHGLPQMPQVGNILIIRNNDRPSPAIWADRSKGVSVVNVTVHSAQGMAFLAQKSEEIYLSHFNVEQAPNSGRFVTTDADAVHCAACRGTFTVEDGLYENMLDDGLNIHGSYMRIVAKPAPDTILLEWVHPQAFGYEFAAPGEHIELMKPRILIPTEALIVKSVIRPDPHHEQITFTTPVSASLGDIADNADWQPTVTYRNNIVRRNRARGLIIKTPRGTVIEGNTFDHLSGAAILLPADASNWFESRPGQNIVIRHNRFIDPNIASYGFAPISFRPNVDLASEGEAYNIRNIRIEDNDFSLFQRPLLEGWSVDGLVVHNNRIVMNTDYPPTLDPAAPTIHLKHSRCLDLDTAITDVKLEDSTLVRGKENETSWSSNCKSKP